MPSWYPVVRAVRYYRGAYTVDDLLHLPTCITQWALTADFAEIEGRNIADALVNQKGALRE